MSPQLFLQTWWNALTSPAYYAQLRHKPWHFFARFVIVSYLLLSVAVGAIFIWRDVPHWQGAISSAKQELLAGYPNDLTIEWNGKTFSANQPGPFRLPYPAGWQPQATSSETPLALAYVAPELKSTDELAQLPTGSFAVLTSTNLYALQPQTGWSTFAWSELLTGVGPFTITRQSLPNDIQKVEIIAFDLLNVLQWIVPIVFAVAVPVGRFVSICFDALLVMILLRWLGRPLAYQRIIQIFTMLFVIAEAVRLFGEVVFPATPIPLFSLILWSYCITIFWNHWQDTKFWEA